MVIGEALHLVAIGVVADGGYVANKVIAIAQIKQLTADRLIFVGRFATAVAIGGGADAPQPAEPLVAIPPPALVTRIIGVVVGRGFIAFVAKPGGQTIAQGQPFQLPHVVVADGFYQLASSGRQAVFAFMVKAGCHCFAVAVGVGEGPAGGAVEGVEGAVALAVEPAVHPTVVNG